jgi:4-hydroxy-2-oxoglutarate aldolase
MHDRLRGIFPPIPTAFDPSTGDVDEQAVASNVRRWMSTGLAGVLALGSNGEAGSLDDAESERLIAAVREEVPRGRTLLVGTGRESTRATIRATARAAALGADAVLVRTPSYFKAQMTTDALLAHFRAVAEASPVPVLLYNLPGVTGITLTVPIVAALAEHPNIAGMKETSPELERLGQCVQLNGGRFAVLCGWAPVAYPALVSGATGAILAVANVLPDACVSLFDLTRAGQHDAAIALQRKLTPIAQLVTSVHGVAGLKLALDARGFRGGPVRGPLLPASADARAAIARTLSEFDSRGD